MRYEFHSHTFLSDGAFHPVELARRAVAHGHKALAITDHVGVADASVVVPRLVKELRNVEDDLKLHLLAGVEITHVPPSKIPLVAKECRKLGAQVVIVHGETVDEPVARGTNAAAVRSQDVDILAHPGFVSEKDVKAALENGVYLEITCKRPHMATNGHVARLIERFDAPFLINGDVHEEKQWVTPEWARTVALGAGMPKELAEKGLGTHPRALLKRRG